MKQAIKIFLLCLAALLPGWAFSQVQISLGGGGGIVGSYVSGDSVFVYSTTDTVYSGSDAFGTVTSVGLSAPGIFSVSGSPVTGAGTLAFSLTTQSANTVFAGPTSGGAATPTFRALVAADLPTIPTSGGGTGTTTTFTQGSVIFAGASGVYTQDNSNFFFNNTDDVLGIGKNSSFTLEGIGAAKGSLFVRDVVNNLPGIQLENTSGNWLLFNGVNGTDFSIRRSSADILYISSAAPTNSVRIASGGVGINTTGPDRKLDVLDASNPQLRLTYTDGSIFTDFQTTSTSTLNIGTANGVVSTTSAGSTAITGNAQGSGTSALELQSVGSRVFRIISTSVGTTLEVNTSSFVGLTTKTATFSGATLTGSEAVSLISGTQTWNTSGNPTAILLNVTNTASGSTSKLIDLNIVSVGSMFNVTKAGVATVTGTTSSTITTITGRDASGGIGNVTLSADFSLSGGTLSLAGSGFLINGGNSGATVYGSNDNSSAWESGGTTRLTLDASGNLSSSSLGSITLTTGIGSNMVLGGLNNTIISAGNVGSFTASDSSSVGTTNNRIVQKEANDEILFYTNTSNRLTIGSDGQHTVNSAAANHIGLRLISSTANSLLQLANSSTGSASTDGGLLYMGGLALYLDNQEGNNINLQISGSNKVEIESTGKTKLNGYTATSSFPGTTAGVLGFDASGYLTTDAGSDILDAGYFKQGGNSFSATATLGTNDANTLTFETNNTGRLSLSSAGRLYSGTLTDLALTVSDSAAIETANAKLHISSGFARLYQGSNIAYQLNLSTQAQAFNFADNNASGFTVTIQGGATHFKANSTDGAETTEVGSNATGAATKLIGETVAVLNGSIQSTVGGVLKDFYTDANNTGTGETDLYTYTTPASTLSADGDKLSATFGGTFAVGGTNEVNVYFAGTQLNFDGIVAIDAGSWRVELLIIRTGASTARAVCDVFFYEDTQNRTTLQTDLTGITWTNTNILKVTGTGAASNEVTAKLGTIKWLPAAVN